MGKATSGALTALAPRLLVYMMSFLTLGIFWVGQQVQLSCLSRSDHRLSWIYLAFIVLMQLNYAIAPRVRVLSRL